MLVVVGAVVAVFVVENAGHVVAVDWADESVEFAVVVVAAAAAGYDLMED